MTTLVKTHNQQTKEQCHLHRMITENSNEQHFQTENSKITVNSDYKKVMLLANICHK
jgi:hypothetical protein